MSIKLKKIKIKTFLTGEKKAVMLIMRFKYTNLENVEKMDREMYGG